MISGSTQIIIMILKSLPFIERLIAKCSYQELRGCWCTCWTADNESNLFQSGTMHLQQVFGTVWGHIYSADARWIIKGQYKSGILSATSETKSGRQGTFLLHFADNGLNRDRLHGTWSGPVRDTETGIELLGSGLAMAAARNEAVINECHLRAQTGCEYCLK